MQVFVRFGLLVLFLPFSAAAFPAEGNQPAEAPASADEPAVPEKTEAAAEPAPGPSAGAARKEFIRVFVQWKELLSDMRRLRAEYQDADEARCAEIEKQYDRAHSGVIECIWVDSQGKQHAACWF